MFFLFDKSQNLLLFTMTGKCNEATPFQIVICDAKLSLIRLPKGQPRVTPGRTSSFPASIPRDRCLSRQSRMMHLTGPAPTRASSASSLQNWVGNTGTRSDLDRRRDQNNR